MIVLPWHFKNGIIQREKEYMKSGGKFIFPLPIYKLFDYETILIINSVEKMWSPSVRVESGNILTQSDNNNFVYLELDSA